MPKGIKKIKEVPEEILEAPVEEVIEKVEETKSITLEARGNVNGISDGYRRTFTNKKDAMAWKEKYNAIEV